VNKEPEDLSHLLVGPIGGEKLYTFKEMKFLQQYGYRFEPAKEPQRFVVWRYVAQLDKRNVKYEA
jgi:hypothetical protein